MASHSAPRSSPQLSAKSQRIKEAARALGFDLVGIAPATPGLGAARLMDWLAAGRHGEMAYMATQAPARLDPALVLEGVVSVIVVALVYRTAEPAPVRPETARISRYAWGADYHDVLRAKLKSLNEVIRALDPTARCRAVVDSAPVMERDYAALAGLGWIGKNTLLLNQRLGSWFFLGALLVDRELAYDRPMASEHCGTCTRCLDECPTQAFDGPYQLDPRRCISYLTIEKNSPIPDPLKEKLGSWAFGCDVCQEVCPWNHKSPRTSEPGFKPAPGSNPLPVAEILEMTEETFRKRFRGTPLFRAKHARLARNVALVAGNQRLASARPLLQQWSESTNEAASDAARWALARLDERGSLDPTTQL